MLWYSTSTPSQESTVPQCEILGHSSGDERLQDKTLNPIPRYRDHSILKTTSHPIIHHSLWASPLSYVESKLWICLLFLPWWWEEIVLIMQEPGEGTTILIVFMCFLVYLESKSELLANIFPSQDPPKSQYNYKVGVLEAFSNNGKGSCRVVSGLNIMQSANLTNGHNLDFLSTSMEIFSSWFD